MHIQRIQIWADNQGNGILEFKGSEMFSLTSGELTDHVPVPYGVRNAIERELSSGESQGVTFSEDRTCYEWEAA